MRERAPDLAFQVAFLAVQLDRDLRQPAGRESTHDRASVAQQARGEAVALREMREQRVGPQIAKHRIVWKEPGDPFRRGMVPGEQRADLRGKLALACKARAQFLLGRGRGGVHEPQERVVLRRIELQRRRGEKQEPPGLAGERLRDLVRAGAAQVVSLVDRHQVPSSVRRRLRFLSRAREPLERGDHQWMPPPRRGVVVGRLRLGGLAILLRTVRVHQREQEVELVEQLRQPLDGEVARRDHQAALHQARVEQAGEHQSGLDGFSQADLVRQHEARLRRREHLVRHADLVGLHVDPRGEQRPERVRAALEVEPHGLGAEVEVFQRSPASRRELLGRALPRSGSAQVRLAADLRLVARHLDRIPVEIVGPAGQRAQHARGAAVGEQGR